MGYGPAGRVTGPTAIGFTGQFSLDDRRLFGPLRVTVPAGGWTCLLGPSGVGESTVLRLLLGLPTAGVVTGPIRAADGAPLAGRIGYMAQSDLLLPWLTVRENTVLGARLRAETPDVAAAERLLDRVGLARHADKKPAALSGGMRQRAALARTLMENRPIVLLDEPFSSLDAVTRADMQDLAAEVLIGKTVMLVTHDPAEAVRLGHQILLMSPTGVTGWMPPATDPVRVIDDPATLQAQSALLAELRARP